MRRTGSYVAALGAVIAVAQASAGWIEAGRVTAARLRGLCVVDARVAWASGTGGTVVRTADAGATWRATVVPGADGLDFRDIHAFDDRTAVVMAAGAGDASRIYRTTDGGATWRVVFTETDPKGFLDAIAFFDAAHGLALGDPIGGRFTILYTENGGATWRRLPEAGLPPALAGEGGFAASGTCLIALGDRDAWIVSGGTPGGRVFHSADRGRTWTARPTPIGEGGPTSGLFSIAMRDPGRGVVVGGAYDRVTPPAEAARWTADGWWTSRSPGDRGPGGYRSAVVYVPGTAIPTLVAVGPTGSDVSTDDGRTWMSLGRTPAGGDSLHAVSFSSPDVGWAVGDRGRVVRFVAPSQPR